MHGKLLVGAPLNVVVAVDLDGDGDVDLDDLL